MKVKEMSSRQAPRWLRIFGQVFSRPARRVAVKRSEIPYWQERGWKMEGNTYRGTFSDCLRLIHRKD